jgi:hypothetical protein
MQTDYNRMQKRQRLLREISHAATQSPFGASSADVMI